MTEPVLVIDGSPVPFAPGQTVLDAALAAGVWIPHLCHHPDFEPHGSCKVCTVTVDGRTVSACTVKAMPGQQVTSAAPDVEDRRRTLLQMLFVEGNHFCPGCEKSGRCALQALAYDAELLATHYDPFFPERPVDASHPDILIDFNRCILCALCVRASRDVDGKAVFAIAGRGAGAHLVVNAPSGLLGDTAMSVDDRAAHVCPVGAILVKRVGFDVPIGARPYDAAPIAAASPDLSTEERPS